MVSHVLFLNEIRISSLRTHLDLHTTFLEKFNFLSCYASHWTIMLFWKDMTLSESCTFMDSGANFIKSFFIDSMSQAINIITTYKPPKLQLSCYLILLKDILKQYLQIVLLLFLGIWMLICWLRIYIPPLYKSSWNLGYNLHLSFSESSTNYHFHSNYIWTNALPSLYALGTLEAYWTDHKPIYLNYKTSNIWKIS
jgi:hypothetical protein